MAGKGGGAWKVAYADFVTAMMAFFLVMWICGQDQSIRRAVSYYFNDPFASSNIGFSKTPHRSGSMTEPPMTGNLPRSESVDLGRGRNPYLSKGQNSVCTKLVSNWIQQDKTVRAYWREQAQRQLDLVNWTRDANVKSESAEKMAIRQLSKQLRDELKNGVPTAVGPIYRDLLFEVLSEVNWTEIAEDLLAP